MTQDDFQKQVLDGLGRVTTDLDGLKHEVTNLKQEFTGLKQDVEKSSDKFSNYQQATQWVVQLAFTLIASATITVIVTAVLKK